MSYAKLIAKLERTQDYQCNQLMEARCLLAGAAAMLALDFQSDICHRFAAQARELLEEPLFPPEDEIEVSLAESEPSNVIPMNPPAHVKGEPA
jgi:hypothetical protein